MERQQVKKVLNCPYKELLELALNMVNLKTKELQVITLVDIKGETQEKTAELLDCSLNTVKNHRNKAYKKLGKVWEDQESIKKILEF